MKKLIEGFTQQLAHAIKLGQSVDLVRPGSDIRNIIITGMGASGIGANLVESLTFGRVPIPITVSKGYNIPQFVSPHTLLMLKRAHIICITAGGKMLEMAKEYNLVYIQVPGGSGSPRAQVGYLMISLLYALYHTNLIGAAFIKETENSIEYLDRGEKAIQSEAELIAKKLRGKLPII
jgi:glucose/mannose-6-phosphate isomerase